MAKPAKTHVAKIAFFVEEAWKIFSGLKNYFSGRAPRVHKLARSKYYKKTPEEARGPKTIKVNTYYIIDIIKIFGGAQGQKRPEEGPPWKECQTQHKTGHPIGTMPKPA